MADKTDEEKAKELIARDADASKRDVEQATKDAGSAAAASELSPLDIPTPTPTQAEIDATKLGLHGAAREKYLTRDAKAK